MSYPDPEKLVTMSRLMARASLAAIILIPVGYLTVWFNIVEAHNVMSVGGSAAFIQSPETGVADRLVGFMISMVPQLALLFGLLQLRAMFIGIAAGAIFGADAADRMRGFARALLAFAILDFIMSVPLSAWVTKGNPPGERVIELSIGEGDLQTYFLIALFYTLTRIVAEGMRLARENAEFV